MLKKAPDVAGCLFFAAAFFAIAGGYVKLAEVNPQGAQAIFVLALIGIPIWLLAVHRYKAGYYDVE